MYLDNEYKLIGKSTKKLCATRTLLKKIQQEPAAPEGVPPLEKPSSGDKGTGHDDEVETPMDTEDSSVAPPPLPSSS